MVVVVVVVEMWWWWWWCGDGGGGGGGGSIALTDARSSTVGASPWARRSSHFASAASGVRVSWSVGAPVASSVAAHRYARAAGLYSSTGRSQLATPPPSGTSPSNCHTPPAGGSASASRGIATMLTRSPRSAAAVSDAIDASPSSPKVAARQRRRAPSARQSVEPSSSVSRDDVYSLYRTTDHTVCASLTFTSRRRVALPLMPSASASPPAIAAAAAAAAAASSGDARSGARLWEEQWSICWVAAARRRSASPMRTGSPSDRILRRGSSESQQPAPPSSSSSTRRQLGSSGASARSRTVTNLPPRTCRSSTAWPYSAGCPAAASTVRAFAASSAAAAAAARARARRHARRRARRRGRARLVLQRRQHLEDAAREVARRRRVAHPQPQVEVALRLEVARRAGERDRVAVAEDGLVQGLDVGRERRHCRCCVRLRANFAKDICAEDGEVPKALSRRDDLLRPRGRRTLKEPALPPSAAPRSLAPTLPTRANLVRARGRFGQIAAVPPAPPDPTSSRGATRWDRPGFGCHVGRRRLILRSLARHCL